MSDAARRGPAAWWAGYCHAYNISLSDPEAARYLASCLPPLTHPRMPRGPRATPPKRQY